MDRKHTHHKESHHSYSPRQYKGIKGVTVSRLMDALVLVWLVTKWRGFVSWDAKRFETATGCCVLASGLIRQELYVVRR